MISKDRATSILRLQLSLFISVVLVVAIPVTSATDGEQQENHFQPMFTEFYYATEVRADIQVGGHVLTVEAHDEDTGLGGEITYSIEEGTDPEGYFSVDPSTGEVTVKKPLDFEYIDYLLIRATDKGTPSHYNIALVQVYEKDVNDNAPLFLITDFATSVESHVAVGTHVISVFAIDFDYGKNGAVTYSIEKESDPEGYFSMHQTTGEIKVAKSLEQVEESTRFFLTVRATDGGEPSLSSTAQVVIRIGPPQPCGLW